MESVMTARQNTDRNFGSFWKFSLPLATAPQLSRSWTTALMMLVGVFALCSCETASPTARVEQVGPTTPVVLSAGDIVRISFSAAPDYNQSQKIRPDGKLSLPQVGEVVAGGKTVGQFESQLRAVYRDLIKETDVSVSLENAVIQIYVTGSVRNPGKLTFDRPTTILQAVMEAGGPNQFGNMRNVHLIRTTNGVHRTQLVDLRPVLAGEPTHAMYVKNGDIIKVPESPF
jgi:polysaccharide export outer membrane protein